VEPIKPVGRAKSRYRVVSIALPPELLKELEELPSEEAYKGRSETVRAALHMFLNKLRSETKAQGHVSATLTVHYNEEAAPRITRVRHNFSDIIRTMVHNHDLHDDCLEVLVLDGPAERVRLLVDTLRGREGINLAEAVIIERPALPEGEAEIPPEASLSTDQEKTS
jgi:CopG family transcriptional regulator, nickel-responsive regulator